MLEKTGKEYQPSCWYFHDFPKDCMYPELITPLKRVYRSIYHYLNCIRDLNNPYLVEHYDSMTGEPISDDADYYHSLLY